MTPIVAAQRRNNLPPWFVKLCAEVRGAGFKGGFKMDSLSGLLRPTQTTPPSHNRVIQRAGGFHLWIEKINARYRTKAVQWVGNLSRN